MQRSIGFWRSWALVVGSTIGTGIFMLPAVLAPYGSLSLLGWFFAGGGTLFIALTLGSLARRIPKVGGPYAYTHEAFGDLPAFLVGWGHWVSYCVGNAAFAVTFVGYFSFFVPQAAAQPVWGVFTSLSFIWLLTGINAAGIKSASIVQVITTLLKLLPLFLIAGGGFLLGDFTSVPATNPTNQPLPLMIAGLIMLTMWAYVGIEAATVPADDVIKPEKNIPRSLIAGTLTITIIYVISIYGIMAIMPEAKLAASKSPFADAASLIIGHWGAGLVAIGAIISIIGAANGSFIVLGMIPEAAARDKLLPSQFAKRNKYGSPAFSIIVSSILASLMIVMNYTKGFIAAFEILILLATLTTLLPYAASALSDLVIQKRDAAGGKMNRKAVIIAVGALGFSLFAIIGSGLEAALYGLILLAAGLPIYYWAKRKYTVSKKITLPDAVKD